MTWKTLRAIFFAYLACGWIDSLRSTFYILDPSTIHKVVESAIAASPGDTHGMITQILANLTATYPRTQLQLNPDASEWVFNNAGGAMGAMYVIHASITESLIIYGTPLGTEGHTGLHAADAYFNILVGEQWAFAPGALEMERYTPGTVHFLPRFTAKQYKMHEGCFALEYARGWIPLTLPFRLLDTLTSTLDISAFYYTMRIMGGEMIKNRVSWQADYAKPYGRKDNQSQTKKFAATCAFLSLLTPLSLRCALSISLPEHPSQQIKMRPLPQRKEREKVYKFSGFFFSLLMPKVRV